MIRINSPFGKSVAVFSTFSLVFCMVPSMAWAKTSNDVQTWVKEKMPKPKPTPIKSRLLSESSMKSMNGKIGENPYAAGQSKWDVVYKGVNLMTGNFTTSGTDLTFEGGYGIPVNVTRSYSANAVDEGPLGKGWTLSVDVRSTAGGMMKSSSAPVRSVPTNFKEKPTAQLDPNMVYADGSHGDSSGTNPISAVVATDSGGTEETIQRDADGILSTPPWDKNKIDSEYETQIIGGVNYQIMKKNWVNTPEGTVYVYQKQGAYTGGGIGRYQEADEASAPTPSEPSNVLKISTATDRHGNVTTYTYDQSTNVTFVKANGTTSEHPLTAIQMPNGHKIAFEWSGNRMIKAKEVGAGGTILRQVQYGYTDGLLTSVTTPGGKVTTYGYGNCSTASSAGVPPSLPHYPTDLMTSITDCRGLTTSISYQMKLFYRIGLVPAAVRITAPNGIKTDFEVYTPTASGDEYYSFRDYYTVGSTDTSVNSGQVRMSYTSTTATMYETREISNAAILAAPAPHEISYDIATQDQLLETFRVYDFVPNAFFPYMFGDPNMPPALLSKTESSTMSNFMGNPLVKTNKEYHYSGNYNNDFTTFTLDRTVTTSYAYWGAEKYYQQKAIKDTGGRLSFKDYYDNTATQGKKGQTYRVYDQARANIWLNTGVTLPSYATSETAWRYQVEVADASKYSAQFDYDIKGRAIDAWKIQNTVTSPWTYVRNHTSYGLDTDGSWGQANQVIEDYGGINRTCSNMEYDANGRATKVQDASGKILHTTFDADGMIQSIEKIAGSTSTPILTYTYGSSGLSNGLIVSVTDNISGVAQNVTYCSSGGGVGSISAITEVNGGDSYTVGCTYNLAGERDTATYLTMSAVGLGSTVKWKYSDYAPMGLPTSPRRLFQRLTNLDPSTLSPTTEEFHYSYDQMGRPRQATFAMTPQAWTPSTGDYYYDASHRPATRGRTYYDYDSGGRVKGVYNWWDTWNSGTSSYSSAPIRANECTYELSTLNRGLKAQSKYFNVNSGSWNLQRTESYGYDANLDYLTSANYGDGLANQSVTWTYDAAGNRASDSSQSGTWSYDNLNRMTASPGVSTYVNDILGNRTQKGVNDGASTVTYDWDDLNRMASLSIGSSNSNTYAYRADGLRVSKSGTGSASSQSSTLYRYDGQMGIEEVERNSAGTVTAMSRMVPGPRGLEAISRTTSSGTSVGYPLYDAHGNNIGMLSKSGSTWSLSDERSYDAWGRVRSGATTGDQNGRFCASLGHKQDDESGLVYMRARYYEPTSGRFVCQDPGHAGSNWFTYCKNDPCGKVDASGKDPNPLDWNIPTAIGNVILGMIQALVGWAIGTVAGNGPAGAVVALILQFCTGGFQNLATATGNWAINELKSCMASYLKMFDSLPVKFASEDNEAAAAVQAEERHVGQIEGIILEIQADEMGLFGNFYNLRV